MSAFDATNLFAAWLGYQMISLAIALIAFRRVIPYRMLWFGFLIFFEVRGWIPGFNLLSHFLPGLYPLLEVTRFVGAWIGVIFGGIFCSSVPSVVQYIKRKREDAVLTAEVVSDRNRDVAMLSLLTRELADDNARRVQVLLKTSHDAA